MNAIVLFLLTFAASPVLTGEKLDAVRQEPNLEKRSEKALDVADAAMKSARAAVANSGTRAELESALEEIGAACGLSLQALKETGKPPKKLGRQYKRGELRTRELVRQLEDLILALSVGDRAPAESARDKATLVHEEFLLGVMGQDKK